MRAAFFAIVALLSFLSLGASSAFADTVAGMKQTAQTRAARDYTLEGEIVTIWEDSFLFDDSTGQMVVDIRPHTTSELKLAGRDYVQVSGHMAGTVFKPMVLAKPDGTSVSFNGFVALPPLPEAEVRNNTARYRFISADSEKAEKNDSQQQTSSAPSAPQPAQQTPPSGSAP